jgi:hypothetical protein
MMVHFEELANLEIRQIHATDVDAEKGSTAF